jgi:hypothetical protein
MFHFDPADYLCPSYLQRNFTQIYGFQYAPEKTTGQNPKMKVSATSA